MRTSRSAARATSLGGEQHGHMESVGYDMYLKLLNEAVALMKGETPEIPVEECSVDMQVQAHIPESYIDSTALRLEVYRRIAEIKTYEDSSDVVDELIDRFGEPPESVYGLIDIAALRSRATSLGITEVKQQANAILLYKEKFDMERVKRLIQGMPNKVMFSAGSRRTSASRWPESRRSTCSRTRSRSSAVKRKPADLHRKYTFPVNMLDNRLYRRYNSESTQKSTSKTKGLKKDEKNSAKTRGGVFCSRWFSASASRAATTKT